MRRYAVWDIIAIIFFTIASTVSWMSFAQDKTNTNLIFAICVTISNTILSLWNIVNLLAMIPQRNDKENGNKDE